jgi:hypothetical protein
MGGSPSGISSGMMSWNSSNIGRIISRTFCEMEFGVPSVTNAMMFQASLTSSINSNLVDRRIGLPLE